jgi:predicted HicB family RNase H-like nuclease
MTALHYKEFQGSVEFEDGQLIIRILHIDDLVTTEIDSAAKAQSAFEELVDDYVQTCIDLDKEPCKPFKGTFNVRVSPELHRQAAMAAADNDQTMNGWIADALEFAVERQKAHKSKISAKFALRVIGHEGFANDYQLVETLHVRDAEVRLQQAMAVAQTPRALIKQHMN